MAKKPEKQLSPERKALISKLIDEFDIKSAKDIEDMFKDMLKAGSTAAMATVARKSRHHSGTWTSRYLVTGTAHSSRRS